MAEKKITKRQMFERIIAKNEGDTEIVEFCKAQIELLDRKASKVDTKKTAEHEAICGVIKSVLYKAGKPQTCSEIMKAVNAETGEEYTLPKISAMLSKMGDKGTGEVVKTSEKKVSYFALAD